MKLNIKDKLVAQNISRYELAKRIGVTYPTITSIYNGDSASIKLETLEALCRELNCTPNEIVVTDDKDIELNLELERLSFELVPIIIEMLNINPQKELDLVQYFPVDKKNEFQKRLKEYLDLVNEIKKGDTD